MANRSMEDNNTWEAIAYDINNVKYSTKTIFKLSDAREIELTPMSLSMMFSSSVNSIKPLYLYDNIIFGTSNNRPALLIGERSVYCEDENLRMALLGNCPTALAKTIIGNEIANFIREMLSGSYGYTLSKSQFTTLCGYTSNFKLKELNTEISRWVCNELENQVGLDSFPTAYRSNNFSAWRTSYPVGTYKHSNDFNHKWIYSIGCFLEDIL